MSPRVRRLAAFESFYNDTRSRLLLQTWALTGDLAAAQKSVQEAFVVAAHHWRKVQSLPENAAGSEQSREDWMRPVAWSRAQRRRSVPHRKAKGGDPEVTDTLAALGTLTITQRKVLVLANLSSVSLEQLAREVGITETRTERELQVATARFSHARDIPASSVIVAFEPLASAVADREWPSAGQLAGQGSTRRRAHTVAGAAVAVLALVGAGLFANQSPDSDPHLRGLSFQRTQGEEKVREMKESYPLDGADLVTAAEVGKSFTGTWAVDVTSDNRASGAAGVACQPPRFATATDRAALVRTFNGPHKDTIADQSVVVAPDQQRAGATYRSHLRAYAGCTEPRVQLIGSQRVTGIGDEGTVLALRDWSGPDTVVVGLSRSGAVTTTVTAATRLSPSQSLSHARTLLARAVAKSCRLPGAGACVSKPRAAAIPPPPAGPHPEMLAEIDLPPVAGVPEGWVGTRPERATTNTAATRCDSTDFTGKQVSRAWTRTFVIPDAKKLSRAFGLTETTGRFTSAAHASAFADRIRKKLAGCSDRMLGSKVKQLAGEHAKQTSTDIWKVTVETSRTSSVTYLMGVVRKGAAVAQIGFVPSGKTTMSEAQFRALLVRAGERLDHV